MAIKTNRKAVLAMAVLFVGIGCAIAAGDVIYVDANGLRDYNNIQEAIDNAHNGDVVVVNPGIYTGDGNRDIDFLGKAITVQSESGAENCIIDCENSGRGFYFHSGEGANSVLDGFTITHGYIDSGGGIYCKYSSPSILNCIISMNRASTHGGGICCYKGCSPAIANCVFQGNRADNRGGGIYSFYNSYPVITNCTIIDNSAELYGDGLYAEFAGLTIENSIVWGNVPKQITSYQSTTLATYSNIQGGYVGDGNIEEEPLLTPDGHLCSHSPCLNAGDPTYSPGPGETDIDGELRVYGSRVDIGVDEFIDTDSDGLPDWWEQKYFADPTIANANDDPDEDGRENLAEYNGGSNPLCAFFYVNHDGNDAWDGLAPVWDGVHGPKLTIQAGIDTAGSGDIVIVADGVYTGSGNRDINFYGRAITVRSENGPGNCIIDCQGAKTESHRGFRFRNGEDEDSVLQGFTIINGFVQRLGGAIYCDYGSPTIRNCVFRGNTSGWKGGAIQSSYSKPKIINCLFHGNTAKFGGGLHTGGVYGSSQGPIMINCTFSQNFASGTGGGGGVFCESTGKTTLTNCLLWGNRYIGRGVEVAQLNLGKPVVDYCCIQGWTGSLGGIGNSGDDPMLAPDGYHLLEGSPCINTGDPNHLVSPDETDIDGQPRVSESRVDIGVDEYGAASPPLMTVYPDEVELIIPVGTTVVYSKAVFIWNIGTGTVGWDIMEDSNWADVSPASGESSGEVDEVVIQVDANGLDIGEQYNFVLTISGSDGRQKTVNVGVYLAVDRYVPGEYSTIQEAIDAAASGDVVVIADGTYSGEGNMNLDFGGKSIAVRSENGPNNCTIDCQGAGRGFWFHSMESEDSILEGFTIINGNSESGGGIYCEKSSPTVSNCILRENTGVLRGGGIFCLNFSNPTISNCTITDNSTGEGGRGGGIYCEKSSPTVSNCTFRSNSAGREGGGIHNARGSSPTVNNCTFSGNKTGGLGMGGGGMSNRHNSSPTVTNCTFSGNSANEYGGGIFNFVDGSATVSNCTFSGNSANEYGGGICNFHGGSATVSNCTFSGNSADFGGGMSNSEGSGATVTNCTFSGNSAGTGGGICSYYRSSAAVSNCIFRDNVASDGNEIALMSNSTMDVNYCDVAGGQTDIYSDDTSMVNWGPGNIDAEPCFVEPGYWADANDPNIIVEPNDPNAIWVEGDYRLLPGSPCIDAGDNDSVPADTTDLDGDGNTTEPIPWDHDGNARIVDGNNDGNSVVDMGAYEYFVPPVEVSMKFTPQALNPGSKGRWVKAHFVLPEEYTIEDVDANSPAKITEPFEPDIDSNYVDVFINDDNLVEVEAAFDRSVFCEAGISDEAIKVMVIGSFTSGQQFFGTDTIKITTNYLEFLGILASHWLEEECDRPNWCEGADLDQDSVVNFVDFALFDGCCIEVVGE